MIVKRPYALHVLCGAWQLQSISGYTLKRPELTQL
uniref:Uncharacterized protein n=1 Tax=Anguilla anguilla TaxID=7936 RepID=A0A0E9R091_ANGAN